MTDLLTDDRLDARLRAACDAVIPRLMAESLSDDALPFDDAPMLRFADDIEVRPVDGRRRILAVAAAVLVVVGSVGVWMAMQDPAESPVGDAPVDTSADTIPVNETVVTVRTPTSDAPCLDEACNTFDRLPVVPGATDYYIGPESLGTPNVSLDWFETLVRCAELTADFGACQKIEGIAGVNLVSYSTSLTVDTTVRNEGSFQIGVGTTFTDISPKQYADQWGVSGMGPDAQKGLVVRGHEAIGYDNEYSSTVVWQERPGVLVWVSTPAEFADQLLEVAAGVRRFDGPTTIPDKTMVTGLGNAPWDAGNNDATGLIAARVGGNDCVGYLWIEQCGTDIGRRTIVRSWSEGAVTVAGSTTGEVVSVRVELESGEVKTVDTVAFADRASRFYVMDSFTGAVKTVSWLDANGVVVDSVQIDPVPPSDIDPIATEVAVEAAP